MLSREDFIDKHFLNISLNSANPDLFYVRKSILEAIEANISRFNGKILDVGCGIMPYRELILERNKKVSSYIGMDFEESITPEYSLGKPDLFWKGDIIPLEDNSIDTIIATEFFEHSPQPESVMKEMWRVLKPGGIIFFTVPFLWTLHIVPYDEYRYTPFSLKRHLQNAGFINVELRALGNLDASLAVMLSIWYQHRQMSASKKKFLFKLLSPIIKRLIKTDKYAIKDAFVDGTMITGLSGVAYKPT